MGRFCGPKCIVQPGLPPRRHASPRLESPIRLTFTTSVEALRTSRFAVLALHWRWQGRPAAERGQDDNKLMSRLRLISSTLAHTLTWAEAG